MVNMAGMDDGSTGSRRYMCNICDITRSKRSLIINHIMRDHSKDARCSQFAVIGRDRRRYVCQICGVARSKLSLLRKHHSLFHCNDEKKFDEYSSTTDVLRIRSCSQDRDCRMCPYDTPPSDCNGSTRQKQFVCPMVGCDKAYGRKEHLKRHTLKHEGKSFPCTRDGCIIKCSTTDNLRRHMKLHLLKRNLQRGREKPIIERKFCCTKLDCAKAFRYPSQLQYHQQAVHEFLYSSILCGFLGCGAHFSDVSALKDHHRSYHKKVCCDICGTSCLRRSLKRHLHIHEIEVVEKRLYCTAKGCLQSYSNSSNLKKHYEVVHLGARAYQCTVKGCDRTFGYKHVRDKHEKTSEHCYGQGDFYEEDLKFQSRPRGGRKPFSLKTVEDLFRKKVVSCK